MEGFFLGGERVSFMWESYVTSSRSLVGLVVSKSHTSYLQGGAGYDWVRILLGLNCSGSANGVSGHA